MRRVLATRARRVFALRATTALAITQQSADRFVGAVETHPNGKGANR